MQAFRNVPFFLLGMLQREWGTCLEGRKEPSILRCFFLLLSSLQVKTCPSRCWCRFFYRLKRTYFCFLRQSHLRKPFALHIADAVNGYFLPAQKDNLSGSFIYSPHLPSHGNVICACFPVTRPKAYEICLWGFLKLRCKYAQCLGFIIASHISIRNLRP